MPSRVDFLDGSKVLYTYDANGTKLRTDYYINPMSAVVPQAANEQGASSAMNLRHTWTDYCGNFIYENDTLKQTLIEGGYISYEYPQNTAVTSISQLAPTYHFYVQDHLGNNRLVVDEGGTIEQINHYYPYGGLMGESKNISSNQRYKYNGKEFDRMHGLDWYDYGARFHDPATVRWFSVDPLAHKYYGTSPYVYCANDPVNKFDPDGRDLYLVGTYNERMQMLKLLQTLTNDRLDMNRKTGQVYIGKQGTKNTDKKLSVGTKLISGIIKDKHSMSISISSEKGSFGEHDIYRKDASNGKGTDVQVSVSTGASKNSVLTRDNKSGKTIRQNVPAHIALGHEIIHGYRSMLGKANADIDEEENTTTGVAEYDYEFTENKLRKEHNLNKRLTY